MSNRNYNTQTNPNRQKLMNGGRAKKNMGGSMNPSVARADMRCWLLSIRHGYGRWSYV